MITKEMLDLTRNKFDQLSATVPGYPGSMAQQLNEQHYQMIEGIYNREQEQAAAGAKAEDPAPTIIVKGGYEIK